MNVKSMVGYRIAIFAFFFGMQVGTVFAQELPSLAIQFEHALFGLGDPKSVAEKMLRVADERDDESLRVQALIRLAFSLTGKVDSDFDSYYQRAAALQGRVSDEARADFLLFGGYVQARGQKDYAGGIASLREAIELARELENDRALVLGNVILAEVLAFKGQYEEARQLLFRASEFSKITGDALFESLVNRRLLGLMETLGSFESAIPLAMKQIEFAKKDGENSSSRAEWILWRAGKQRGYIDYLRKKLQLPQEGPLDSSSFDANTYRELIRLAFVIRDQSPNESIQYAKSAAEHFRSIGRHDRAGWAEIVAVMAKANLVDEKSYPRLIEEFQQTLKSNANADNAIQHLCMNDIVAKFLQSIGDEEGAFEFQRREIYRLRTNADQATSSSRAYAKIFYEGEKEYRSKNREIESQNKTISSQQETVRIERQRNSFARNALIATISIAVLGSIFVRQLLLQRHRKRLQQEVHEKTLRLKQSKEHAEEARDLAMKAVNAKTDFYAQLNHEIRNPLQAIVGFAEILQLPDNGQDKNSLLDGIRGSGEHLMRLVNNALDMSSIEKGKVEIVNESFDLHDLIEEIAPILRELCEAKSLTFSCDVAADVPRMFLSDEVKIRQILLNLAMNSIKFTDSGFVNIQVEAVSQTSNEVRIRSTVRDSGCGISDRELKTVFDPFSQSATAKATRTGSGLGLYICKSYCELMGGSLEAKSVPGEGSTFICDLHLQLAADKSTQPGHNRSIEAAKDCKNLRVLIVDDNAMVRDAMAALMGALECDFKVADGFSETKKILSSWTPDFIFLDIHMPEADGYQVARYIRKLEKLSQVAVIALTGDAVVQVRERALQAGFDDLLAKPISTSKLRLAMQKYRPTTPASRFESVSSQ